jgi:hypothetical protein
MNSRIQRVAAVEKRWSRVVRRFLTTSAVFLKFCADGFSQIAAKHRKNPMRALKEF